MTLSQLIVRTEEGSPAGSSRSAAHSCAPLISEDMTRQLICTVQACGQNIQGTSFGTFIMHVRFSLYRINGNSFSFLFFSYSTTK